MFIYVQGVSFSDCIRRYKHTHTGALAIIRNPSKGVTMPCGLAVFSRDFRTNASHAKTRSNPLLLPVYYYSNIDCGRDFLHVVI